MKASQKPGVVFQPHVHRTLQRGISTMVGALRPTLGPLGGGVAIDHMNKAKSLPEFVEEGGVIARRVIELTNRDEDMGAMLVRSMLLRQHEETGDGTATTAVLFEAIVNEGLRYLAAGGNAMLLRRALEKALPQVLDSLDQMTFQVDGEAALTELARTQCHDDAMAALLGEAFDLVGAYGRLEIREDYGRALRLEYVEGSYYSTGVYSRALLPAGTSSLTLEEPSVFLCDFEIEDHRELFPVLSTAYDAGVKGLLIVTRNLSEKAISLLVAHNRMDKFKIMAVKLPGGTAEERMAALDDLALLTGAAPFIKATGTTLEGVQARDFGSARRVWADERTFCIVGGKGDPNRIRDQIARLKRTYRNADDAEDRKRTLNRIGVLLGGAVTLWVGGFTEPEISAQKRVAERAALTIRSALQEGVVPGGGIALLNCRNALRGASSADSDERAAERILSAALAAPARTIFRNAGYDPGDVLGRLHHECAEMGFDVVADRVVNMREAGIVDGVAMLKTSVRNAVSTAALTLTIDSLVHLAKPEMIGNPR